MASNLPSIRVQKPLKTPANYGAPTQARPVGPNETRHLLHEEQKGAFLTVSRTTTRGSSEASSKSGRSAIEAARKGGKAAIEASKKAAVGAVHHVNKIATKTFKTSEKENKKENKKNKKNKKLNETKCQLSHSSSSSSSTKSLFHRRRLPKLQIPEVRIAVREALDIPCSIGTPDSASFALLELSPTSRVLKYHWQDDDEPEDVRAEFHNMLSARRRVRKGKFGAEVTRYCLARPTWKDRWGCRCPNDNREDRELLKNLTDALQEQKDYATRLVQKSSRPFPGFEPVSCPGCTLKMYWQHKSAYPGLEGR
ncbi:hypothetical protein F5Y01DRAFT_326870 [Xylaria sp. FL0043]|nr:hypothetical protein F5Y01DRAFT_326870 [Xylaria sp. FL0043]